MVCGDLALTSYHALERNDVFSNPVGCERPIKGKFRYGGSEAKLPTSADTWSILGGYTSATGPNGDISYRNSYTN